MKCCIKVIWCSTITLLLVQIAFTQPEGVLGHCPVEKQMKLPLSSPRWDGVSLQKAVLVKCALNSKLITDNVTSKAPPHPHTITHPPPCFTVGTTHAEMLRSPTLHLTKTNVIRAVKIHILSYPLYMVWYTMAVSQSAFRAWPTHVVIVMFVFFSLNFWLPFCLMFNSIHNSFYCT